MFASILAIAAGTLVGSAAAATSAAAASSAAPPAPSAAPPAPAAAAPAPGGGPEPLTDRRYTWPDLPYQVDTDTTGRGPQSGYNICNSTTVGPHSNCQTAFINSAADFCLWGPPTANGEIGDIEASSVAYCTTGAHGTRIMPAGTITALQFLIAPAYVQVTGLLNQGNINEDPNDSGGELDPHGADERGNPLGALVFSNAFPQSAGNLQDYIQVIQWHSFMGSGMFCFKACNPNVANSTAYCDNIYDLIGCAYNAPAAYEPNVFETCLSDNQDPPGIYTGADGVVSTYHQPAQGQPLNLPYTAKIPATSACTTYTSAALFTGAAPAVTSTATSSGIVTAHAAGNTGSAATPSASAKSTSSAQSEGVKLGGAIVAALGVLVGAVMVM